MTIAVSASLATPGVGAPQLVRLGSNGAEARITFTNVGQPDGVRSVVSAGNPVINGHNLYAPDLLRVGDRWYCYHGGWLASSHTNDRIYLGISTDLEPTGPWAPASQLVIGNGGYIHVHDPSVVVHDGTWHMVYTAFKFAGAEPRDWINYSSSADGLTWTPSPGTNSTEIVMTDPGNIAGGTLTDMARPSLVRTDGGWKMWFDAQVDNGPLTSFLAHASGPVPTSFTLVHKYPTIDGFPGFFEPDVVRRPNGQYIAVVQRHFRDLYLAQSTDGVNFTLRLDLSATHPLFGREKISNPGLLYDQMTDRLLGLGFGMTDSPDLVAHDIGFSAMQYTVAVRSPGNVWHGLARAERLSEQSVLVFEYTSFDQVRLTNPASGQTLLQQAFTSARVGDVWHVQWEPGAPVLELVQPDPDTAATYREYTRELNLLAGANPVAWSLVAGPATARVDASGRVSGWMPSRAELGQTIAFEVAASNASGSDRRRWSVTVLRGPPDFDGDRDVDQEDFGAFQGCLSGSSPAAPPPSCGPALLNDDIVIDASDFAIFFRCLGSPGQEAPIDCAR